MAKSYLTKRFKYVVLALACAVSCGVCGIVGCTEAKPEPDDEKKTSREDTQLLKNGNFEFLTVLDDDVKADYVIDNVQNWGHGGTSSSSKSGIISTSEKAWEKFTGGELGDKLDYNNALDSSAADYSDKYIDYNGMTSKDLLFKDTYAAVTYKESENDNGNVVDPRKVFIDNPGTHYNVKKDGDAYYYIDESNAKHDVYLDEKGDYYLDEELTQPFSHVLMLHNYNSDHNGIAQYYSSVSVDLPENTAAEISFWVKTTGLRFSQGADVTQDRGAYAAISHKVGDKDLDDFAITSINTEKLLNTQASYYDDAITAVSSNGWVQYTVYINACDFSSTTITLKMGLGEDDAVVEGYAFFDDVKVTKFVSLDDTKCSYNLNKSKIKIDDKDATCTLLSEEKDKKFKADYYSRNGGSITDERYSRNYYYLLDLASNKSYVSVDLSNFKVGLTVDKDKYTTVKDAAYAGKFIGFTKAEVPEDPSTVKLPKEFASLKTESDLLACVKADYEFKASDSEYYAKLNDALKSAKDLPNVSDGTDNNLFVMLSAYGAAYTASMEAEIEKEGYTIISFWVKTSDMNGSTALTVKVTDKEYEDNTQNFTLDTTGITTDIDEKEDIYNGWVQCFLYMNNESKNNSKKVNIDVSFGKTEIKESEASAYKPGWAAVANVQLLNAKKEVFEYISSGEHTAKLTVGSDDKKSETSVFDSPYGSQTNNIKTDIVDPSTYFGVNGGSSNIVNNKVISLPFDDKNTNDYAGLISKEYFGNYTQKDWYSKLLSAFNASSTEATAAWSKIFGSNSVQPLLIVNNLRETYVREQKANENNFKDYFIKNEYGSFVHVKSDDKFDKNELYYSTQEVMNYGFIGEKQTASADTYTVVTVKVKVSVGAVAYVYLCDPDTKDVLSFTAPKYSFYYDEDGNVLKSEADSKAPISEQRANILYKVRTDGLYEDANGKLVAYVHNYSRQYTDESATYYDKDGNKVSFEDLAAGTIYYKDQNKTTEADCYLVTDSNARVYQLKNGKFYYIVDGKASSEVAPFDTSYARYDYSDLSEAYWTSIKGTEQTAENWTEVNFIIHTGNTEKNYRLELWSGSRENFYDEDVKDGSAVIFDYNYLTVSDEKLCAYYEAAIVDAYQNLLESKGLLKDDLLNNGGKNIAFYEQLVNDYIKEGKLSKSDITSDPTLSGYNAHYYTYSLFDSPNFKPYNADAAQGDETAYDYKYGDNSEKLAYLSVKEDNGFSVFVDYSAIDQKIDSETDDDSGDETDGEEEEQDEASFWLLLSSILLVIVLVFAMLSLYARYLYKKYHRTKPSGKSGYNSAKADKYIKKLHIKKDVYEEVESSADEYNEAVEDAVPTPAGEPEPAPAPKPKAKKAGSAKTEKSDTAPVEEVNTHDEVKSKKEKVKSMRAPKEENQVPDGTVTCPKCGASTRQYKMGHTAANTQRYRCMVCKKAYSVGSKKQMYSDELKEQVIKEHEAGATVKELMTKYGISKGTVQNWTKKR